MREGKFDKFIEVPTVSNAGIPRLTNKGNVTGAIDNTVVSAGKEILLSVAIFVGANDPEIVVSTGAEIDVSAGNTDGLKF